jgi:hypothetical protein
MSTLKTDTLSTVSGSGSITVSTGLTASSIVGVNGGTGGQVATNFSSASTMGMKINDTNSGNLGGMLGFYSGSGAGTLRANIQNANNAGVHFSVGTGGSVVFTQTGYTAANALDDYEKGTWTPTLDFGGGTTGITYGTQAAVYTKIGNVVYFSFRMYLTSKGSSTGHAHISGFPFTVGGMPTGGVMQLMPTRQGFGSNDEAIHLYFNDGGTRLALYQNDWDGTPTAGVGETQFANNTECELTAFYFT